MEKSKSNQPRNLTKHIWLIFILGFIISAISAYHFYREANEDYQQRVGRNAKRIIDSIEMRLQQHELALIQAKAFLMHGRGQLNQKAFEEYLKNTELMDNYPGMQALAYIVKISDQNLSTHVNKVRREFPQYKVWPPSPNTELTSITYIAPMNRRNSRALGFNMMTEPIRRSAMEKARDSGKPTLSKMLVLMQEDKLNPQPGFILYVPIYGNSRPESVSERRQKLTEYITSPFRIRDFIRAIISKHQSGSLDFKMYDSDKKLIYHHDIISRRDPDLVQTMTIGENVFTFHFYADAELLASRSYYFSVVIALMGLLLTILIMRIFYITQKQIESKQTALDARDEFLSIASHELKTPITSLKLQLEMAKRIVDPGDEKLMKGMDNSIYQVSRLTRLIEDLLEISKISNGKQTYLFEKTDIGKLLSQICETHSEGRKVKLNIVESLIVECDHFKIEQVFSNLITNAIKYGEGSPIEVSLISSGGKARISIKDSGPGIPEDLQEKIFDRFERVTSQKSISGLGLGLYISKQIVDAHQGSIRVESKPGMGSNFIVELPLKQ